MIFQEANLLPWQQGDQHGAEHRYQQ